MDMMCNLNVWEIDEYELLLCVLSSILVNEDQDQPLWTLSPTSQFTVGSFTII